jgi:hypothetical protein
MRSRTRWAKLKAALRGATDSPASGTPERGVGREEAGLEAVAWAEAARAELEARALGETANWAGEQVRRVAARLNRMRVPRDKLEPALIAAEAARAFTLPGRRVYVPRGLLRGLPHDGALAFVLAHEMAHHDLGHIQFVAERIADVPAAPAAVALLGAVRMLRSADLEVASDVEALKLCLRAGYPRAECLEAFRAMETLWAETGGAEIALGFESGDLEAAMGRFFEEAPQWQWERKRGYLSFRDRRARLERPDGGPSAAAAPR